MKAHSSHACTCPGETTFHIRMLRIFPFPMFDSRDFAECDPLVQQACSAQARLQLPKCVYLQGLGILHRLGLVHADVKSGNTRVDMCQDGKDMYWEVVDLGSCQTIGTRQQLAPLLACLFLPKSCISASADHQWLDCQQSAWRVCCPKGVHMQCYVSPSEHLYLNHRHQ